MNKNSLVQYSNEISDTAQMYKALGDETRLRILGLLRQGELCVCDIMEVLHLPQSTVSRHLAYLKHSGWLSGARRGKWMYYQLCFLTSRETTQGEIVASLRELPQCEADQLELKKHLKHKKMPDCS